MIILLILGKYDNIMQDNLMVSDMQCNDYFANPGMYLNTR